MVRYTFTGLFYFLHTRYGKVPLTHVTPHTLYHLPLARKCQFNTIFVTEFADTFFSPILFTGVKLYFFCIFLFLKGPFHFVYYSSLGVKPFLSTSILPEWKGVAEALEARKNPLVIVFDKLRFATNSSF